MVINYYNKDDKRMHYRQRGAMKRSYQSRQKNSLWFCGRCHEHLPEDQFCTLKSGPHAGYVQSICNPCKKKRKQRSVS